MHHFPHNYESKTKKTLKIIGGTILVILIVVAIVISSVVKYKEWKKHNPNGNYLQFSQEMEEENGWLYDDDDDW